jgi:tRNA-dihydrouridine synthase C
MLTRSYPEATELFNLLRRESDCLRIDGLLGIDFIEPERAEQASA